MISRLILAVEVMLQRGVVLHAANKGFVVDGADLRVLERHHRARMSAGAHTVRRQHVTSDQETEDLVATVGPRVQADMGSAQTVGWRSPRRRLLLNSDDGLPAAQPLSRQPW